MLYDIIVCKEYVLKINGIFKKRFVDSNKITDHTGCVRFYCSEYTILKIHFDDSIRYRMPSSLRSKTMRPGFNFDHNK